MGLFFLDFGAILLLDEFMLHKIDCNFNILGGILNESVRYGRLILHVGSFCFDLGNPITLTSFIRISS